MEFDLKKKIAVIILNWNASRDTCKCLEQVLLWEHVKPLIYVVDNNSIDNSHKVICSKFHDINLICNDINMGFSGGNNVAFRNIFSRSFKKKEFFIPEFFLLLNNDAFIKENDILLLLNSLEENINIGVIGPVLFSNDQEHELLNAGGCDPSVNGITYWKGSKARKYIAVRTDPYEVDYVSGTVALLRSQLVHDIGYFDEDYFFSCEMADLCERIKKKDFLCVIHPSAMAYHKTHSAIDKSRDALYLYYSLRNRFLFIRKFRQEKLCTLFCYWMFMGGKSMIKKCLIGKFSSVRAIFLAIFDGIMGRYGGRNFLFKR